MIGKIVANGAGTQDHNGDRGAREGSFLLTHISIAIQRGKEVSFTGSFIQSSLFLPILSDDACSVGHILWFYQLSAWQYGLPGLFLKNKNDNNKK